MYVTEHLVPRETSLIRRIDIKNVRMKAFFPSHNHICVVIARCLWSRFHASSLNRRPPFLVVDSFSRNGIRSRRLLSEKSRERERGRVARKTADEEAATRGNVVQIAGRRIIPRGISRRSFPRCRRKPTFPCLPASYPVNFYLSGADTKSRRRGQRETENERQILIVTPDNLRSVTVAYSGHRPCVNFPRGANQSGGRVDARKGLRDHGKNFRGTPDRTRPRTLSDFVGTRRV